METIDGQMEVRGPLIMNMKQNTHASNGKSCSSGTDQADQAG